jgi:hypothetical protein
LSRNRGILLVVLVFLLLIADVFVLAIDRPRLEEKMPFQRACSGIGLSSAVSVSWSFFGFDPRTESACENELWPIPGLACPNPCHGTSVASFPARDRERIRGTR